MEIDGVFEPPTPAKPVPARSGPNSQGASSSGQGTEREDINDEFLCTESLGSIEHVEGNGNKGFSVLGVAEKDPINTTTIPNDTSCIQEEADCDGNKLHGVNKSQDFINSTPSPSETKYSSKRRNNGIDLNKKPSQRPRVKKHRPKVYDDSKPKKIPKVKTPTKPKTPKPVTPNPVQERRAFSRKEKFTTPSTCMQNSTSYDIEDVEATSRVLISALIPCKRQLDLNLPAEIESHHVASSKSHDEFDFIDGIVKSKRNTKRRSRFQDKGVEVSNSLLGEDDDKQECGLDFSVIENLKETKKHVKRFVNVYRCQKKSSSKRGGYKVYQRKFNVDQCLHSSKKRGPNFPKMFKKQRTMRQKVSINANWLHKFLEDVRPYQKQTQITKKKVGKSKGFFPIIAKKKRSILQKRRRENLEDVHFPIIEFEPLQEVPHYEIESFTSKPSHIQEVDNSVCGLEWLKSKEVVKPKKKGSKLYAREINSLVKRLAELDINGGCKALVVKNNRSRALVVRNKRSKALAVVNDESMALVEKKPKKPKKPKLQAWIDLDEESLRVWKIVMENNGSQPFEKMDNEKKEWWEQQRSVFRGRVKSFIAKMHLIQGNRRFSPWKGSVVDSVVGVYLTQNVSDHLSSSAFMNLAARFPVKPKKKEIEYDEVNASQESDDMITSYADEFYMSQTTQLSQTESSNLQDKPFLDENPQSFRNLLDIDEVDYLKNYYNNDESALNEITFQEKSTLEEKESMFEQEKSTLEEEKSKSIEITASNLHDKPCVDETLNTFRKVLETEESGYLKNFCSINIDESSLTESTIQEKSTLEQEKSILTESSIQEKSTLEQKKSTLEEEARIVASVSSLESEITMEQGVNNQASTKKGKKKSKKEKIPQVKIDWDKLREKYGKKERNEDYMDAVDWDAVWRAPVEEITKMIEDRGMQYMLAGRIKDFLDRMVKDHGSIDLEWLREVPPHKAKEFLLSIPGIGLKSVECVRLLTLHHNAFPVDTNVARVATRLGWVPLKPLPEQLQIHLLNSYPMSDTIQKYLYPRLCTLDEKTLYELHYQLITFGKVFCTKKSPNCNACPMRAECRHYASACASARLALPGPKESSTVTTIVPPPPLIADVDINECSSSYYVQNWEPIVEVPPSPEPYVEEFVLPDIEDYFRESDDEIPTIRLNNEEFKETIKNTVNNNNYICDGNGEGEGGDDMSKAIVVVNRRSASYQARAMKIREKLRTIHNVYVLPDLHPILAGFDEREEEDPSPYLLAIWPETSSSKDTNEETVKGTILIPCRTANRGKFPLNGTYFQVNEVFADDETSEIPMNVPRKSLWNLARKDLCCGRSATSIFKALSATDIEHIFWKGSICVRGFNRKTRQPRRLSQKLHSSIKDVVTSPGKKKKDKK